ncbi:MAG: DEAD/DEAH box helicase family protein [Vicinamibacterales bacterium]
MADVQLAEFQQAAVDAICERLSDKSGSRRFLLADEVGLGKTIVARGVLQELSRRRKNKPLTVVYLCSNGEIADQNRTKLDPDAEPAVRRITRLATERHPERPLKLYSFTPGTSLSEGTGLAWERQLLLFLVFRLMRVDIRRGKWREFFRCGAGPERWRESTSLRTLRTEFHSKLSKDLQQRIAASWKGTFQIDDEPFTPWTDLEAVVKAYQEGDQECGRKRTRIIGLLRLQVQRVLLQQLDPDLVILDEVQRFREVLAEKETKGSLAGRLFDSGAAVLILSATPYRMLSLDHEGDDHYDEFLDTVRFLFGKAGDTEVAQLRKDLKEFRERLDCGEFLKDHDRTLMELKTRVEGRLRRVIARTERNWYTQEDGKGVEEVLPSPTGFETPNREELADFVRLRHFLLDKVQTSSHVTEYWKSCPAPFTFMDAQYAPMIATRKSREVLHEGVVARPTRLKDLHKRSLRFRRLFKTVFGDADTAWRFLWVRPSYTYYRDQFFNGDDPKKVLVFSSWRFVPKAIALLTSHEAERRIVTRGWSGDDRPPLRFTDKGSFHIFDVCLPSPALASLVRPADLASPELTSKKLLDQTERALRGALSRAGIQVADTSGTPLWQVVARLEETHVSAHSSGAGSLASALQSSETYSSKEVTERFQEHAKQFIGWMDGRKGLRISRERVRQLARIAAFSPGNCLLRAFWSVYPEIDGQATAPIVDLCFEAVRSYFNRRTVREIVERATEQKWSYARSVLEYADRAHFQAVIDEHVFFAENVLQQATSADAAAHLTRVFGLGMGTPNVNVLTGAGYLGEPHAKRSHFALAFADEAKSEQGDGAPQSASTRKTAIREAFNSPFWPFVLATTSVGQEGLDFHLYCRDIVHWNLPSNPVDLEQREGRINRRDGLALRRAIASEWPHDAIRQAVPQGRGNVWQRVYQAIGAKPGIQRYKHGLYPHWVFDSAQGQHARIRRHLFFYADSHDALRYDELKERLALYRLVFGQPRQQDLLDRIRRSAQKSDVAVSHSALTRYMVNLSPITERHARRRALNEALLLLDKPNDLQHLVNDVERLQQDRDAELFEVRDDIQLLKTVIRAAIDGERPKRRLLLQAVSALVYLRDPYDAVLDQHQGVGLADDIEQIKTAARRVSAAFAY